MWWSAFGIIHILRQHIFLLFLTHPPYVSIYIFVVAETWRSIWSPCQDTCFNATDRPCQLWWRSEKTKLFPFAQLSWAESCQGNLCTHVLKTTAQGFFEYIEFQTLIDFDAYNSTERPQKLPFFWPTQSLCWRDIGMVPLPSSCLLAPILQVRRCRHPFILWLSSYSYQTLTKLSHPVVVRPHLCTPLVTLGWHWFWSRSWFLFFHAYEFSQDILRSFCLVFIIFLPW